jgi:hypothetical protein
LRGKSWSIDEERLLRELINEGACIDKISKIMGKTRVSVRSKMYHLGLAVVDAAALQPIAASVASIASVASTPKPPADQSALDATTSQVPNSEGTSAAGSTNIADSKDEDVSAGQLKSDGPLPTIEEQLHVLNAAIVALQRPGLSGTEVSRLNKIIDGVKVYQDSFAKFVDYRGLERKILELEKRLASEENEL